MESVGAKLTERSFLPTGDFVPTAGVYVKTPATDAVALSCLALRPSAVVMLAGVAHVMVGVNLITTGGVQPLIGIDG